MEDKNIEENNDNNKDKLGRGCKIALTIQYIIFGIVYLVFRCSCGHPFINIIPVIIFFIFQYILIKYLAKKQSLNMFLVMLISIPILVVVIILTKTDMDKVHRIEAEDVENSYVDPISTRSLDLSK